MTELTREYGNIPKSPVSFDGGDDQAADAIAKYLADRGGEDLDVFDGEGPSDSTDEAPAASSPETDSGEGRAPSPPEDGTGGEAAEASKKEETQPDEQETDAQDEGLEVAVLAEILGVDEGAFQVTEGGDVVLNTKVNGSTGTATLGDLIKSYQLEAHVNQKSEKLAEEQRQLRESIAQREQQLAEALQNAGALETAMEDQVRQKYAQVDWNELRTSAPGEYAALRADLEQDVRAVKDAAAKVRASAEQALQRQQVERNQHYQAWLGEQRRLITEHIPEVRDPVTRTDTLREFDRYLTSYGFTPEETQQFQDHRFLRVIADGYRHHKAQAELKANGGSPIPVSKRVARVPRVLKPGAPKDESDTRRERLQAVHKRLRQSGSDDDAAHFAVASGIVDDML